VEEKTGGAIERHGTGRPGNRACGAFCWSGFRWSPLFGLDADRQDSYVIL
jgi:hypothetical protein